ncbi:glutathione S-transferase [Aspergillus tamarii]|uniref:Glutathione S-transferase n=1 Tax=Aspergillus tamarii TaxID=41984 RepID=A0A5N6VF26_ASPTM|nr:glutathione S-transferase [Aspergillus tamarii]
MSSFYAAETPERVKKAQGLHLITSLTPNGRKVHILLEELKDAYDLEWTTSLIDLDKNEQKKDWFLRLNPDGRIPILVDNNICPPHVVMESSAELLYLVNLADENNLFWFSDPIDQSEAFQWLIFWHASGQPNQAQYNFFRNNADQSSHAVDRFKREVLRVYDVLEIRLSGRYGGGTREYLAGQGKGKYSIADINAWAWIRNIRHIGFSENELAKLPHLQQWVDRIAVRPAVERGLGEWYDEDVHPELLLETA